jgi:hypothetical protein
MPTVTEQRTEAPYSTSQPTSLVSALDEVEAKRRTDLIRFRTCCADPRASK